MADDAKSGTGNPVVDALVAALGAFNKDSLGALRPVRAIDGVPFAEIALAYAQMKRAAGCISAAVARKAAGGPILFDPDEKLLDLAAFRGCLTALDILIPLIEKDVAAGKELLEKETTELTFSVVLALIAPAISMSGCSWAATRRNSARQSSLSPKKKCRQGRGVRCSVCRIKYGP